jgi:type IV secretion system protein VirD4
VNGQPRTGFDPVLAALVTIPVVAGVLWAGGALSALLSGHKVPPDRPLAGLAAIARPGNPALVWHGPVGPAALYWICTVVVLTSAGLVSWACWRLWHALESAKEPARRLHADGLATRTDVRGAAGSKVLLGRTSTLRPSLDRPKPSEVGYRLGMSQGIECWASVEDSMLLLGPPRSGKGMSIVVPMILDAPGAVVTTSTRPDNVAVTLAARQDRGPVAVFDPQILARPQQEFPTLRWSLVRGCENPQTAMIRAEALVADASGSGVENANFWRTQALSATRCMLHAAALDHRPPAD